MLLIYWQQKSSRAPIDNNNKNYKRNNDNPTSLEIQSKDTEHLRPPRRKTINRNYTTEYYYSFLPLELELTVRLGPVELAMHWQSIFSFFHPPLFMNLVILPQISSPSRGATQGQDRLSNLRINSCFQVGGAPSSGPAVVPKSKMTNSDHLDVSEMVIVICRPAGSNGLRYHLEHLIQP
ncbi:hypothetical protein BJY00DRAFT_275415 [Aspergillus carlsbadensis]|nr:hypothetical protein BJY00DRAFT_275415 [Aspergillus carlsbadensis]